MRYFALLAYHGANYCGWQRQPQQPSVQQFLEDKMSMLLRGDMGVTGCGRTDTGVHASRYYMHFDAEEGLGEAFTRKLNQVLPPDIAVYGIAGMPAGAHARFDATRRSYTYHLILEKDPFRESTATYFPYPRKPDFEAMREAAGMLLEYEAFFPFCRSNSDAQTMECTLFESKWVKKDDRELVFTITANRFLRGMVRLIVGMCVEVGLGKTSLGEVKDALDRQVRLPRPVSAPPEGLFLADVQYPYPVP